uniref:uncharacterized protein LOC120341469 n=1 Tax=Styela clava TaxID=7725 RepID=UPI00193A57D5|nr:uncharacterized protein LOC120341469 [Styela clava]
MFSSTFIWLVCLGGVFAIDISMNIQLGSKSVSDSCDEQATITASSEEELRDKLTKKLESVLMQNPDAEITISTQINVNGQIHSTKITNSDITSTTGGAIDISTENVATTVALLTTGDVIAHTMGDVITEFDTRSVTSIAPSTFESTTPLKDQSTETEMITEEQKETTSDVVTDSTMAEATTEDATTEPNICDITYRSKRFYIVMRSSVSFEYGKSLCGDKLANIYTLDHFKQLTNCLRLKIPSERAWVKVWTGLTYKDDTLQLSSGQRIDLSKEVWRPGYPERLSNYVLSTNVAVKVKNDTISHDQGIYNCLRCNKLHGAICEKEMN